MTTRRSLMTVGALMGAAAIAGKIEAAQPATAGKTYVLASGSWHGGWSWGKVAAHLRAANHQTYTPSYTGLGDRAHLLRKDITIETFVEDLVNVILSEELQDVVLVGHSFGGVALAGVADKIPERIRHLVYLDGVILENGKSAFDAYLPADREARLKAANEANGGLAVPVPNKLPALWGLKEGTPDYDWVLRRLTPHPLNSYTSALHLKGSIGNKLPCTYIECTAPVHPGLAASKKLAQSLGGWNWKSIEAPHDAMITHPRLIAELLMAI